MLFYPSVPGFQPPPPPPHINFVGFAAEGKRSRKWWREGEKMKPTRREFVREMQFFFTLFAIFLYLFSRCHPKKVSLCNIVLKVKNLAHIWY